MGLNFYHYDGLQPKMRAGIVNEHECTISASYTAKIKSEIAIEQTILKCLF